jgi:hypothetical protein
MHAEDEFSASTFGSSKRDAVRLLRGTFPVRFVVEGPDPAELARLIGEIDGLVALGQVGHLPIGGHKMRGAGWGLWNPQPWQALDVQAQRAWTPTADETSDPGETHSHATARRTPAAEKWRTTRGAHVVVESAHLDLPQLTLGAAARAAREALGKDVIWWCEPTIDLSVSRPRATFGWSWPADDDLLRVDEVAFFTPSASWRAARTAAGTRRVLVREVGETTPSSRRCDVRDTPAALHNDTRRFSDTLVGVGQFVVREWLDESGVVAYTLAEGLEA